MPDTTRCHVVLKVTDEENRNLFDELPAESKESWEPIEGHQPQRNAITQYFIDLPERYIDLAREASNTLEVHPIVDVQHQADAVEELDDDPEEVISASGFPDSGWRAYHDAVGLPEEGYTGVTDDIVYFNGDTGVSPLMQGKYRVVHRQNFVSDRAPNDVGDGDGHGSMTISLQAPFGAKIGVVRCLGNDGSGGSDGVAKAIRACGDYAAANPGSKVIANFSLGGGFNVYRFYQIEIEYARQRGVSIYFAAGNDGQPRISAPANSYPGIASIAFDKEQDLRASFSNYSQNAGSSGQGYRVIMMNRDGRLVSGNGTSFSCPGRQRCVGELATKHSLAEVEAALNTTCRDTQEPIAEESAGIIQARAALRKITKTEPVPEEPTPEPGPTPDNIPLVSISKFKREFNKGANLKDKRVRIAFRRTVQGLYTPLD